MKTILVATDNSLVAINALHYAADFAADTNKNIVLLTCYEMLVSSSYDVAFANPTSLDIESSIRESHNTIIENLKLKHPQLVIESVVIQGNTTDTIINEAKKNNAELIVAGVSGRNAISSFILGSTTKSIIHENKFPVLAIPENATYKGIHRTAFAFDHKHFNRTKLEVLTNFLHTVKSKLLIINVVHEIKDLNMANALVGLELENLLYDVEHTYHYPADENIAKKLYDFCAEFSIDCLAVIPHHHSLLEKIFASSQTDKILEHITIPLLSIPE